jgi:hypothetical protein
LKRPIPKLIICPIKKEFSNRIPSIRLFGSGTLLHYSCCGLEICIPGLNKRNARIERITKGFDSCTITMRKSRYTFFEVGEYRFPCILSIPKGSPGSPLLKLRWAGRPVSDINKRSNKHHWNSFLFPHTMLGCLSVIFALTIVNSKKEP